MTNITRILIYGAIFSAHPPRWIIPLARRYHRQTGDTVSEIIIKNPRMLADACNIARNHLRVTLNDAHQPPPPDYDLPPFLRERLQMLQE